MNHLITIFLTLSLLTSCAQNTEPVYLLFTSGEGVCNLSPYRDGSDKKEVTFKYQKSKRENKIIRFEICYQYFEFNADKHDKKTLAKRPENIISIDSLLSRSEATSLDKVRTSEPIYILEKNKTGGYTSYRVQWVEVFEHKY